MEALMDAEAVAKLLGVSPSWVKKKSRQHVPASDRIPSIKLGKMVRYRKDDIYCWIKAKSSVTLQ